ncbi:hypothetical protein PZA11_006149 [Diplocarpon coronariae]|uniref:SRP9 domain-containing protein n=1 Tax=Diplocarpon coronariae TaxID=2795749 RepID=A0A218Z2H8_9HELO|nr:hypothetical protein JHW43_001676 [Diplocarpon mali]OWP02259.1 hypothetical protein B2J93_1047 [Marssonina coronariae]
MPLLPTAQSWLTQSTLLLQARPSTTRITSKYTVSPPSTKSNSKSAPQTTPSTTTDPAAPRATLTLKTYDPVSGTTLKYETNKAAEVSRLIQILGRLARPMAGLPELEVREEGVVKDEELEESAPVVPAAVNVKGAHGQQQAGKGKGKKRGKK